MSPRDPLKRSEINAALVERHSSLEVKRPLFYANYISQWLQKFALSLLIPFFLLFKRMNIGRGEEKKKWQRSLQEKPRKW